MVTAPDQPPKRRRKPKRLTKTFRFRCEPDLYDYITQLGGSKYLRDKLSRQKRAEEIREQYDEEFTALARAVLNDPDDAEATQRYMEILKKLRLD